MWLAGRLTPVARQMTCTAIVESSSKMLKFSAQSLMACCESDCFLLCDHETLGEYCCLSSPDTPVAIA